MLVKIFKFLEGNEAFTDMERFYGKLAVSLALESKDVTKVGAVIYKNDLLISRGINELSKGVVEHNVKIDENNKTLYTIHAEMNAITSSAQYELSTKDASILIVGKYPCCECAKSIIASGIVEVLCPPPDTSSRWKESNLLAKDLFSMAGIKVRTYEELTGVEFGLTCPSKYIV